jgi:antitoxin component YwqK of YwqJK toxin-antitoxin module
MSDSNTNQSAYGKLYYDTGELLYEGYYSPHEYFTDHHYPNGRGICYYINGGVYREGQFQRGGLLEGKEYYPSGELKFEGRYNCRKTEGSYYGPAYPLYGKYYSEDGSLLYEGEFKIIKQGSVRYPRVIFPENFGPLK